MWIYSQGTGTLSHDGMACATGYSGAPACKNDPTAQAKHNLGPIPRGLYKIEDPRDTDTHGPYVLPLAPSMDNQMFGRSGFLIHGDSILKPGGASEGCIIMERRVREEIGLSGDRLLEVVA